MSRLSNNQIIGGRLINGYDYRNQAWVKDGRYQDCGHPETMKCTCFGRKKKGYQTGAGGKEYFNVEEGLNEAGKFYIGEDLI